MDWFDSVITGARVVDPANGLDDVRELGFKDGKVAEIAEGGLASRAWHVYDMSGYVAVPGIIDSHVHMRAVGEGNFCGFTMSALSGVCTVLEMWGHSESIMNALPQWGCGMSIALLEAGVPGLSLSGSDPSMDELDAFTRHSLDMGCFGTKLLGGHYPLTPEASSRFLQSARKQGAYVAWHVGTTATGTSILGMREACQIADGGRLHLAHVNGNCRGIINDVMDEIAEAMRLLEDNPAITSESYLSIINGLSLHLGNDGKVASRSLASLLKKMGYTDDGDGVLNALRAKRLYVIDTMGIQAVRVTGEKAAQLWLAAKGKITGSMDANPALSRTAVCLARRKDGSFTVDAISTDGGRYPRNSIVSHGLALVKMEALSMTEFAVKTSYNPARMLGLANKGHLGLGADGDVTVVDPRTCEPVMTLINGKVNLYKGAIMQQGGTVITTPKGVDAIKKRGLPFIVTDPSQGPLPFRKAWK